jgi:hypothetical protein
VGKAGWSESAPRPGSAAYVCRCFASKENSVMGRRVAMVTLTTIPDPRRLGWSSRVDLGHVIGELPEVLSDTY